MQLQKVIGENIQRIRKEKQLSQLDLCEKIGKITQARLSTIESGQVVITIKTLEKIAKALAVPPILLLNDIGKHSLDLSNTIEAINLLPVNKRKPLLDMIEAYIQRELDKKSK